MADPIRRYNIITLRPHWAQYIISQGMSFIISCALFLVAGTRQHHLQDAFRGTWRCDDLHHAL